MKDFILTLEGKVKSSWIDESGHMNVMWYTYLFDRGSNLLLEKMSISTKPGLQGSPTVTVSRIYTAHRKELLAGESWQLWSGISQIDSEGISFSHRLLSQSQIKATCDIKACAFDLKTRRKTALAQSAIEKGKQFLVPGLLNYFDGLESKKE